MTIAEEGSFLRAAARLHISQPPLSSQIKALETELGVQLFERSTRGITLTPGGEVFYREIRSMLTRLEQAKGLARRAALGNSGSLSIGFVSIADYGVLPPSLRDFRERYPNVDVHLHELTTDAQIREIMSDRLDLGIGLAPIEEDGLAFESIVFEPLILASPADHPLTCGLEIVDLRDLREQAFVLPPRALAPGLYDLVIQHCRSCGFAPRIPQPANQMQTVISLVAGGLGFALVPSSMRNLQRAGVRYLPLSGEPAQVEMGFIYRKSCGNPVLRNFIASALGTRRADR